MPIDYSKYPPNWRSEIVPRILKRAGNRCEICGLKNRQKIYSVEVYLRSHTNGRYGSYRIWIENYSDVKRMMHHSISIKIVKVVLTVAHLDHDETNHNIKDNRLRALCQKCHLEYDSRMKYLRSFKTQPTLGL